MHNHEIIDKIREANGPVPELEPQIVKSRQLLTYYAGVLLRKSEEDYLDFCVTWGFPIDWMVSSRSHEPLEPNEVAFTHEGQRMMLELTREDFQERTYAATLLLHLVKSGPQSLTPKLKKKLYELTVKPHVSVRGPTQWSKDIDISVSTLFFSLLRAGYFVPEDAAKGRKIADKIALQIIDVYKKASDNIHSGGQIRTRGVEGVMACTSSRVHDAFTDAMRSVIGDQYHKLSSKSAIDAINRLSGDEQRRAIDNYSKRIKDLLGSIPLDGEDPETNIRSHTYESE